MRCWCCWCARGITQRQLSVSVKCSQLDLNFCVHSRQPSKAQLLSHYAPNSILLSFFSLLFDPTHSNPPAPIRHTPPPQRPTPRPSCSFLLFPTMEASLPQLLQSASLSLEALNAPNSNSSTISQANNNLEAIKNTLTANTVIPFAEALLSPLLSNPPQPISLHIIHFGFHVIDVLLLSAPTPWSDFPEQLRQRVRSIAVILFDAINMSPTLPNLVAEKTIALVSGLAIREWPQNWPEFLDTLLNSTSQPKYVCKVLTVLAEDVFEYPHLIVASRRQELSRAMTLTLKDTLRYIITATENAFRTNDEPTLMEAVITLKHFVTWAHLRPLFAMGVPRACILLLKRRGVRMEAAKVLRFLGKRDFENVNSEIPADYADSNHLNAHHFRDVMFTGMLEAVCQSPMINFLQMSNINFRFLRQSIETAPRTNMQLVFDPDEHAFHVALMKVVVDMGRNNFMSGYIINKRNIVVELAAQQQEIALGFIELLLATFCGPSLLIRKIAYRFFSHIITGIRKNGQELFLVNAVSQHIYSSFTYAAVLSAIEFPPECDDRRPKFDEIDQDLDEEYMAESLTTFHNKVNITLVIISMSTPQNMVMLFLGLLSDLLAYPPKEPMSADFQGLLNTKPRNPKALGLIRSDGAQYEWKFGKSVYMAFPPWKAALQAVALASDSVTSGAFYKPSLQNIDDALKLFDVDPIMQKLRRCFEQVLQISDPAFFALQSTVLRSLWPLYSKDNKALEQTFQILIRQGSDMQLPTGIRFKACLTISVLCRRLNKYGLQKLKDYRQPMCDLCASALQSATFETHNKALLVDACVSIILATGDLKERTQYIEKLLHPIMMQLSSPNVLQPLTTPMSLFEFMKNSEFSQLSQLQQAFHLLEVCEHRITRGSCRKHRRVNQNALSASIAPKGVDIAYMLVKTLHGLYNPTKFPSTDAVRASMLLPSCKEFTIMLNLESGPHWKIESFEEEKMPREMSLVEKKSREIIAQFGFKAPDKQQSHAREFLMHLRRSGYDILRSAILSGVSNSARHFGMVLEAITCDCHYAEPLHLKRLTRKVLATLFSFEVASSDTQIVEKLEHSNLADLLKVIREHIEASKHEGVHVSCDVPLLDIARDYGRLGLGRSAAEMLVAMYPTVDKMFAPQLEGFWFTPRVLSLPNIGNQLIQMWQAICCLTRGCSDNGASRVGLDLVATSVQIAPENCFDMYKDFVKISLETAVQFSGMPDSVLTQAIGALLGLIRKWPKQVGNTLMEIAGQDVEAKGWVQKALESVHDSNTKTKKHRAVLRRLAEKLSVRAGLVRTNTEKVKALPNRLRVVNPAREAKQEHQVDVVLGDTTLDSLFGDGAPM